MVIKASTFREKDDETGWNHFEFREYDPIIGRPLSVDPRRQFFSPYVWVGNNPIRGTDPTGGEGEEEGGPQPGLFSRFVSWVKGLFSFSPATEDADFNDMSDIKTNVQKQDAVASKAERLATVKNMSETEVTPYVSVSAGKQANEALNVLGVSVNGQLTFTKYGIYISPGLDATYSPFNEGLTSVSLSGGFMWGPKLQTGIPGLGIGGSAGSFFGVEYQGSFNLNTRSFDDTHQLGVVISTSPVWVSGNAQYTLPVYTNNGLFKP